MFLTHKDFSDAGAFWLREYESDTIKEDIEGLWQTLKPFYQQLHAYVRAKLRQTYKDQITEDGLIPAHLLGTILFIKNNMRCYMLRYVTYTKCFL